MDGILKVFGLQWGPFLAQVIIILIVYLILSKYAFGPVLELLEARRRKIAEGEVNLKKIKTDLAQAEEKIRGMMVSANKEADRIIAEAKLSGDAVREQKAQSAVVEANQIVSKARAASEMEHERVMSELKADFGRLVIGATSKVTGKVLDDGDQKRINEEVAGQVSL